MVDRWCVGREVNHGRCAVSLTMTPGQYEQLLKIPILLLCSGVSKYLLWSAIEWLVMVIVIELL